MKFQPSICCIRTIDNHIIIMDVINILARAKIEMKSLYAQHYFVINVILGRKSLKFNEK